MLRAACLALLLVACGDEPEIKPGKPARFHLELDTKNSVVGVYILSETATGCEWVVVRATYALTMDRIPQWGKKTCGAKP